jgi:hypothetical protein
MNVMLNSSNSKYAEHNYTAEGLLSFGVGRYNVWD